MCASEVTWQLHPDTGAQENPTIPRGETQGTPGELESWGVDETMGQGGSIWLWFDSEYILGCKGLIQDTDHCSVKGDLNQQQVAGGEGMEGLGWEMHLMFTSENASRKTV